MLFHTFNSQEERRSHGGSAFIELQFCRLPAGTSVKKLVAASSIHDWQNDSLYIEDEDTFFREYRTIFDCGIYNNGKSGPVDIFGINYYAPSLTDSLIEKLRQEQPEDYETLLQWLRKSKAYNGFYILGI